jgi:hypothetical protein
MIQIDWGGVMMLNQTCLRTLRLAIKAAAFLGFSPAKAAAKEA